MLRSFRYKFFLGGGVMGQGYVAWQPAINTLLVAFRGTDTFKDKVADLRLLPTKAHFLNSLTREAWVHTGALPRLPSSLLLRSSLLPAGLPRLTEPDTVALHGCSCNDSSDRFVVCEAAGVGLQCLRVKQREWVCVDC